MIIESKRLHYFVIILLFLAFGYLIFYKLGDKPLLDYDESIYAQVARQSFESGDHLSFKWKGNLGLYRFEDWFEKPPLMIWLTEGSFAVFGINEFGARVSVAIFSLLTVGLTFYVAKKLFNSYSGALLSVALYFIVDQWIYNSRVLQFDIPVTFFILLALFGFYLGKENSRYYFLFWTALGLGVLTKSVIGLLPMVVILIFSLLSWDFAFIKNKYFYLGGLVFVMVVLPWHLIEHIKHGKMFWEQYFYYHLLKRFSTGLEGNGRNFSFYWDILQTYRVLFYLSITSFIYFIYRAFKSKAHLFILTSVLVIFLFFSYAQTKLEAYILPVYTFLIIMTGTTIAEITKQFLKKDELRWALYGLVVSIFVFFGFRSNNYKLETAKNKYYDDSKSIGLFLRNNKLDQEIYYYSEIGTKPSVIFYSNRIVYFLHDMSVKPRENFLLIAEISPKYINFSYLFSTPTHTVYQVK
ncbi:MAG TPA: glycosyltransferase family 39 protein [Patescibacteria group bacterium]